MPVTIATFNVENLMSRFDFSGFRNQLQQDRVLSLYEIADEAQYRQAELARSIALTDDTRQLSALAIAETDADILCLQEVDSLEGLRAFEYNYLFKMVGEGYREKYLTSGNDTRGIDVAIMLRPETRNGLPIEFVRLQSHAHLTFGELGLFNQNLAELGIKPENRIFRRDCLEVDLRVGGMPLTIYCVHFKSMGSSRNGVPGRIASMPVRHAEALAVRRIITDRFGEGASHKRWVIAGDLNDYSERIVIGGDRRDGFRFTVEREEGSSLDLLADGAFAINPIERLPELERWTLYHTRGPQERHLCQLDYLLLSPALAAANSSMTPRIIRNGQPFRTIFPPGQEVERFPRTGWDRPKASDHCPVVVTLDMV